MQTARMETGSKILFEGQDLLAMDDKQIRAIRGADISMIFQEPMTSLNPVYTTGNQVMEAIMLHQKSSQAEARAKTIELFREVGIPDPEQRIHVSARDVWWAETARDDPWHSPAIPRY